MDPQQQNKMGKFKKLDVLSLASDEFDVGKVEKAKELLESIGIQTEGNIETIISYERTKILSGVQATDSCGKVIHDISQSSLPKIQE